MKYSARIVRLCAVLVLSCGSNLLSATDSIAPVSARPTTQEILRCRLFEEPLVHIGAEPTATENAALAAALNGYSKRASPDDFSSLTEYLQAHPMSPWRAALLVNLGLEYYNTAHYS